MDILVAVCLGYSADNSTENCLGHELSPSRPARKAPPGRDGGFSKNLTFKGLLRAGSLAWRHSPVFPRYFPCRPLSEPPAKQLGRRPDHVAFCVIEGTAQPDRIMASAASEFSTQVRAEFGKLVAANAAHFSQAAV